MFSIDKIPNKYRKLGKIEYVGHGAMGMVYHIAGERVHYALKIINCKKNSDKYMAAKKEVEIMKLLSDCLHVISLLDSSEMEIDGDRIIFILEPYAYPLSEYLEKTTLSASGALKIAHEIANAMRECEKIGVLHLDIQPHNVFLTEKGTLLLGDFSNSLYIEEMNDNKNPRGTLAYMAPEVFRKHECSVQSDIYSLGVLIYCLFNNMKFPFSETQNDEIIIYKRLAGAKFPKLNTVSGELLNEVEAIIKKACAFEKAERYVEIDEIIDELDKLWKKISEDIIQDCIIEAFTSDIDMDVDMITRTNKDNSLSASIISPEIPLDLIKYPKKQLFCFLIDCSSSNSDSAVAKVNAAVLECLFKLKEIEKNNYNCKIDVTFLVTSEKNIWISTPGRAMHVDEVVWTNLEVKGQPRLGKTLSELNKYFSRKGLFNYKGKIACPHVIYIGNGDSVDEWMSELERIKSNGWFEVARKSVFLLDPTNANDFVKAFVGESRDVIYNIEDIVYAIGGQQAVTLHAFSSISPIEPKFEDADPFATSTFFDKDAFATTCTCFNDDSFESAGEGSTSNRLVTPQGKYAGGTMSCESESSTPYFGNCVCQNCGRIIGNENFCPNCGAKVLREYSGIKISKVNFSAVAPYNVRKGEYSEINVIMYEDQFRQIVNDIIETSKVELQEIKPGPLKISENARIKMIISSPDIEIEDDTEEREWIGDYLDIKFSVFIPCSIKKSQVYFTISVYINNIMSTRLKFITEVTDCTSMKKIQLQREDVRSAFVSFAEEDKNRVLRVIQGIKLIRPDMDIFMDLMKIRARKDYEYAVKKEIDYRDTFYLGWSRFAQKSSEVEMEWKYALLRKGITGIEPLPLELPENCPPPQELSDKHFNDKIFIHLDSKDNDEFHDKVQIAKQVYFDKANHMAYRNGMGIAFTRLEDKMMECLVNNIGRTMENETLAAYVYENEYYAGAVGDTNVRRLIKQLRGKLGPDIIETVTGIGYKISKYEKKKSLNTSKSEAVLWNDW